MIKVLQRNMRVTQKKGEKTEGEVYDLAKKEFKTASKNIPREKLKEKIMKRRESKANAQQRLKKR